MRSSSGRHLPRGQSDRVHIVKTDSMTEQNKKIIDRITELNRAGIPYREMAIIFRTNTEPRALASKLMERHTIFDEG